MLLQVIAGAAWLIWLSSGTAGLKDGLMVGALLVVGFGVKNLLDTFWTEKHAGKRQKRGTVHEHEQSSRFLPSKRGSLPSPNWDASQLSGSGDSSVLRRFDRKLVDPRV
jgi:hypothetical protein